MNYVNVEVNGVRKRVAAVRAQGRVWFHWEGETYVIEPSQDARRGGGVASASPGHVAAPMPGKVTKVSVAVGDAVTKGQVLVVMEAMKMEYALDCDLDGVVAMISVAEGDQVVRGATLVKVEPPA